MQFHDAEDYEARAAECRRLAYATHDLMLREEILSLSRIYSGFASHLRGRDAEAPSAAAWALAVNE